MSTLAPPSPDSVISSSAGYLVRAIVATIVLIAAMLAGIIFLPPAVAGGFLLGSALLYLSRRLVFNFSGALFILAGVVLFIPIRRFAIPSPLSFQLEPYRFVIVLLIVAVTVSLLIDPTFTWRKMPFGVPLAVYIGTLVLSMSVNTVAIVNDDLVGTAFGGLVNVLLIFSVLFLARQFLDSERIVMTLLAFLAWGGGAVGFFAVVEKTLDFNIFLMLNKVVPLVALGEESSSFRAGGARSYASAEHPIALSVLLCMLIPIAIYLAKYGRWPKNMYNRHIVFGLLALFMVAGIGAAVSRTAIVVLGVIFVLTLIFRPFLAITLALLAMPVFLLGVLLAPDIVGSTFGSFFDIDGLVASQYTSAGMTGAGRLADIEPAMAEYAEGPIFGTGFGTRIVVGETRNSFILDNHVLGTLLEAGAVGVAGLAVIFLYPPIRLLVYAFRTQADPRYAQLGFALAISASAYVAASFFYDAFGFMQTLLVLCMLLAVGGWLLTEAPKSQEVNQ